MFPLQIKRYHLPGSVYTCVCASRRQDRPALPAQVPQGCFHLELHGTIRALSLEAQEVRAIVG
jgi:hypothetical protein